MSFLTRKYPFKQSEHWLRDSLFYGIVIWAILYFLQPFGFSMYVGSKCLIAAVFGLVTSGCYALYGWTVCDGEYLIHLDPTSGDPNLFSAIRQFEYDATLRKQTDEAAPPAVEAPKRNAHFKAICWKVSEDQRTMWLDDVSDTDINKNEGRHEAVPYVVREDYEPRCSVDAFIRGGSVAEVYTNAEGEITILNWAW